MSFDDEFRAALRAEVDSGATVDSHASMQALLPAMRRARRARTMVSAAAVSMVVVLLGVLAIGVRGAGTERLDPAGPVEAPGQVPAPASHDETVDVGTAPDDRARTAGVEGADLASSVDDHELVATIVDGERIGTGAAGVPVPGQGGVPRTGSTLLVTATVVETEMFTPPTAVDVTTSMPATTATTVTTTTVTSTTQPPPTSVPSSERFDCACGYVIADRSSGSVSIVEIRPNAGYRAVAEDPDRGSITIQFTGGGEDCELLIPATGPAPDAG
jgi:hypothetical protein